MGEGEAINLENMEDLYAYVRSWGTGEEDGIPFTDWKVVDEYREPIDPNCLSESFAAVFLKVETLLNYCVERKVILNDIT